MARGEVEASLDPESAVIGKLVVVVELDIGPASMVRPFELQVYSAVARMHKRQTTESNQQWHDTIRRGKKHGQKNSFLQNDALQNAAIV
jgi:hypothetical protein